MSLIVTSEASLQTSEEKALESFLVGQEKLKENGYRVEKQEIAGKTAYVITPPEFLNVNGETHSRESFLKEKLSREGNNLSETERQALQTQQIQAYGCGSIGGSAAYELARIGASNFVLVEPDMMEIHNETRLPASHKDTGKLKLESLTESILGQNPFAKLVVLPELADIELIKALLDQKPGAVIWGLDDPQAAWDLHKECSRRKINLFSAIDLGPKSIIRNFLYGTGNSNKTLPPFRNRFTEEDIESFKSRGKAGTAEFLVKGIHDYIKILPKSVLENVVALGLQKEKNFWQTSVAANNSATNLARQMARVMSGEQLRVPEQTIVDGRSTYMSRRERKQEDAEAREMFQNPVVRAVLRLAF